jgi:hypothetical protein
MLPVDDCRKTREATARRREKAIQKERERQMKEEEERKKLEEERKRIEEIIREEMINRKEMYLFVNPDKKDICSYISFNEANTYIEKDNEDFNIRGDKNKDEVDSSETENLDNNDDGVDPFETEIFEVDPVDMQIICDCLLRCKTEYVPGFDKIAIYIVAPYYSLYDHLKSFEGMDIDKELDLHKYLCAINDCGDAMEYIEKYFNKIYWEHHVTTFAGRTKKPHNLYGCDTYIHISNVMSVFGKLNINPSVLLRGLYYYFTIADVLVKNNINEASDWIHSHNALYTCLYLAQRLCYEYIYNNKLLINTCETYDTVISARAVGVDEIYVWKCFKYNLEPYNVLFRDVLKGFVKMVLKQK